MYLHIFAYNRHDSGNFEFNFHLADKILAEKLEFL